MFDKTASLLKKAGLAAPVYLVWPVWHKRSNRLRAYCEIYIVS